MDNQEAIDELQYAIDLIKQNGQDWLDERDIPILGVAISALQAQEEPKPPASGSVTCISTQKMHDRPTDGLISRQEAIDALCRRCDLVADDDEPCTDKCNDIKILEKMPSAQPEIVKCKKCRYVYYDKEFGNYWCDRMSGPFKVEADGYCKWGK